MDGPAQRARSALIRLVRGLAVRNGTGRGVLGIELTQELCAAAIQSASAEQDDAEVSEVSVVIAGDGASLAARVKVCGRAWPPRPPVDTRLTLRLSNVSVSSEGASGRLMFVVDEPLTLSSAFADAVLGLLSALFGGPRRLEELRRKGAVVSLDFSEVVRAARPDLSPLADLVRLHKVVLSPGLARLEIGFNYG